MLQQSRYTSKANKTEYSATLEHTMKTVRISLREFKDFETRKGLRQSNSMPTVLFYLVLEKVMRDVNINRTGMSCILTCSPFSLGSVINLCIYKIALLNMLTQLT